jgi:hypothetical protein
MPCRADALVLEHRAGVRARQKTAAFLPERASASGSSPRSLDAKPLSAWRASKLLAPASPTTKLHSEARSASLCLFSSNTPFRRDLGGSVRQSKRLLRHGRAVTRDLLPFAAHLDESVRGDDGVRAMFALELNVIGVLVDRHRR